MEANTTCFEVKVTPKNKKRAPLDPSPILMLERFKGTPSLSFKDVKVGASSVKGLWIENPNDCIITVILSKLPPEERLITFSETEFVLEAHGSKRLEVTWSPSCEGSWREIIQVQVWGLPPPHLSFRVVLHLTSVQPKIKRKCCQMALPPLRAHNARITNMKPGQKTKANVTSKCCQPHACHKMEDSKENIKRRKDLVIRAEETKRNPTIDRDSLEGDALAGQKSTDHFAPVDDGLLPPCNVPSTPIRRSTYNVNGDHSGSGPKILNEPSATFTIPENSSPKRLPRGRLGFLEALESSWFSPPVLEKTKGNEIFSMENPLTPSLSQWSLQPGSERCSTEIKNKNVTPLSGRYSEKLLFPNLDEQVKELNYMSNQSSPLLSGAAHSSTTPLCLPIRCHSQNSQSKGVNTMLSGAEYSDFERRSYVEINVNNTYIKEIQCESLKLDTMQRASIIIQRTWRRLRARQQTAKEAAERQAAKEVIERQMEKEATERFDTMQRASVVIQRSWRRVMVERLAAKEAAERLEAMQKASVIIQRNWRMVVAKRQSAKEAAKRLETVHKASLIIQRNWRRVKAERQAAKKAAERLEKMQQASEIIQRNWKRFRKERQAAKEAADMLAAEEAAKRLAAEEAAERLKAMERASVVIQRNWRRVKAERQATDRLEKMQKATLIIQRNWRKFRVERQAAKEAADRFAAEEAAKRLAAEEAAERLKAMERASVVIQRNWRRVKAERQATDRLEKMQKATLIIQRNWRKFRVERQAAKEAADRLAAEEAAERLAAEEAAERLAAEEAAERLAAEEAAERLAAEEAAERLAAEEAAERLAAEEAAERLAAEEAAERLAAERLAAERLAAEKATERPAAEEAAGRLAAEKAIEILETEKSTVAVAEKINKSASTSDDVQIKFSEKLHLKPRACDLLCELAALHTDEDLSSALKYIQDCVRNGVVEAKRMCDKTTQTDGSETEFVKPTMLSVRKSMHTPNVASISNTCRASRRSLMNQKSLRKSVRDMPLARSLSPIKRRNLKEDLPEKESWSSVAEAVGRNGFPFTKKH